MPIASVNGIRLYYEVTGSQLKIRRAAIGGLSMGGNIALNFALAYPNITGKLSVGEHDEPCLTTHRFMADCIPGSTNVVIRDVGHVTNLEAPAAFNAAVKRFLSK